MGSVESRKGSGAEMMDRAPELSWEDLKRLLDTDWPEGILTYRMAQVVASVRDILGQYGMVRDLYSRIGDILGISRQRARYLVGLCIDKIKRWDEVQQRLGALKERGIEPIPEMDIRQVSTTYDKEGEVKSTSVRQTTPSGIEGPRLEPDHPAISVGPGYVVKGTTTLLDADGRARAQYVMVRRDPSASWQERISELVDELKKELPQYPPIPPPKARTAPELLNVYTITDYHFGMHSWGEETGADWDLEIADRLLDKAAQTLINSSPPAETAVINFGGDTLHYDSEKPITPAHGHILDADSRQPKMVRVAVRAIRRTVTAALRRHRRAILLVQEGNHDPASSVWIRTMMAEVYRGEKRLEVVTSHLPYYAIRHGKVMLGFHHGHLRKPDDLPKIFAAQFREMWGQTLVTHIHCGHRHHLYVREHEGAVVIQHPTLAARDGWAARNGYLSQRAAIAHTYHSEGRLVATTHVGPEVLMGQLR